MRLERMICWERNSWAYHVDDGRISEEMIMGASYGTTCAGKLFVLYLSF